MRRIIKPYSIKERLANAEKHGKHEYGAQIIRVIDSLRAVNLGDSLIVDIIHQYTERLLESDGIIQSSPENKAKDQPMNMCPSCGEEYAPGIKCDLCEGTRP